MKIWIISDTHNKHNELKIPKGIDLCIHAGDCSNTKERGQNSNEVLNFFNWVKQLSCDVILIPGNHDTSLESKMIFDQKPNNLIILRHEFINYKGINIFGSPYTPTYGTGWAFNKHRQKLDRYWQEIPENIDILITHGPPKSILDSTENYDHSIEMTGCKSLLNHIIKRVKSKYHIFGHLHNEKNIYNSGQLKLNEINTIFINASVVDLKHNLVNNGYILNYKISLLQRIKNIFK